MPICSFNENFNDGTNAWLAQNADKHGIDYYIENDGDRENQRGIGGGIDLCVSHVKTEFVNLGLKQETERSTLIGQLKEGNKIKRVWREYVARVAMHGRNIGTGD